MTAKRDPLRVFGPISAWEVRSLAGPVVELDVAAGVRLVREGLVIGTFFLIRSGRADLMTGEHKLATLEVGDCFGEIDAAPTRPQRFTVTATVPTRVLTFSAFGISRLCATIADARDRILAALPEERLGARGAALHDPHAAPRDERDSLANAALALAVNRS
jgi:CRP-like cAMP-binding protein